ncbi:hypothetical protein [Candidatus Nitrosotenuis cloacae]|uniref:hypothetical protein n=1 Tax=Candidatus Nitrosotenuis cloacae TaxID=1603555 RepID=UPI00069C600C|nr:hypothetical protein [Candidatus Nitrosotenuis cloacae]
MKFNKPLKIRGTKDDFVPFYTSLNTSSKLHKSITDTIDLLKQEPTRGDHIERNKIPDYYIKKFKIKTLFRIELVDYWRLMYAIHSFDDVGIGILVLEALDHKKYNARFGYKN